MSKAACQMSTNLSYFLSFWVPLLIVCLLSGVLLGAKPLLRSLHKKYYGDVEGASIGIVVASLLGLLGFLIAFTFGMAANRFEERRQAVLAESNTIGTVYLRTELLAEQQGAEARDLLRKYVAIRSGIAAPNLTHDDVMAVIEQSITIQNKLWKVAANAVKNNPSPITALFVQATNELIDVHSTRVMLGTQNTIPIEIWICLYAVTAISLGLAGLQWSSTQNQSIYPFIALLVTFTAVLTLVADLDDPLHGFIRTDQTPMLDLAESLNVVSGQS